MSVLEREIYHAMTRENIIAAAIAISKGRCGGTFLIVDQTGKVPGSYTELMEAINVARYKIGYPRESANINYDDNHQATVIVLPGDYSAEGRIAFSAKNLHIIGLGLPGTDTGVTIRPVAPTTFAFGGSGTGIELANFAIAVDSAVMALYWELMDGNCWFHDLMIMGDSANATHGIYTGGVKASVIENNRISGFVTSGITLAGGDDMYFYDGVIKNNQIGATATCAKAIYVASGVTCHNGLIEGNKIIGDNFTKTIDIDATAADVMTVANYLHAAGEGGTSRGDVSA